MISAVLIPPEQHVVRLDVAVHLAVPVRGIQARRELPDDLDRPLQREGAALVELALCVTILLTLTFGTFELGYAWKQRISLQSVTRSSARVGSNLANDRYADREVVRTDLQGAAGLPGGVTRIRSIVSFNSTCPTYPGP